MLDYCTSLLFLSSTEVGERIHVALESNKVSIPCMIVILDIRRSKERGVNAKILLIRSNKLCTTSDVLVSL
jgi:hypothetical protein